jgi:mRNA-degrading endonuclease RelE of RelBE toxin-antitoxin system
MVLIETPIFTRRVLELLDDEDYRSLQIQLVANPEAGDLIPGSGGLRKIRWRSGGRGKPGGVRVIYYLFSADQRILMLYVYSKSRQTDLTVDQVRMLAALVKAEMQ